MTSPEMILEHYIDAVKRMDKNALLDLYAPDMRMFDMMAPWEFSSRQAFERRVDEWFGSGMILPDAIGSDVETRVEGNFAFMTMFMNYIDDDQKGERSTLTNRLTWVLAREGDDWKIIHEHTSVPISDEHDGKPLFEMK